MDKARILEELTKEASLLDKDKLKEVYDFTRFLVNREEIDPTLEILQSDEEYNAVKEGLRQKAKGELHDWDNVK